MDKTLGPQRVFLYYGLRLLLKKNNNNVVKTMAQKGKIRENHGKVKALSEKRGSLSWSMMKRGGKRVGVATVFQPSLSSQLSWKA